MSSMYRIAIAGLVCTSACIEVPPPIVPDVMCVSTSDCRSGESCDEGICWGSPPDTTQFAAILVPPDSYPELVPTEIVGLSIAQDGTMTGLELATAITLRGRVLLECFEDVELEVCNTDRSIAAQIQFSRPSRIPGGPTYSRTVHATGDRERGEIAFTVQLPRTINDERFTVTITPEDALNSMGVQGHATAQLAPPERFDIAVSSDADVTWTVGQPDRNDRITGRIVSSAGQGLSGMQVWAVAQHEPGSDIVRVSSLADSDDSGSFELVMPSHHAEGTFDLVIKPVPGVHAPTVRFLNIASSDITDAPLEMPSFPAAVPYLLPVRGVGSAGADTPVQGASVELTTLVANDANVLATFTSAGVTDISGDVRLHLIPGGQTSRLYTARVIPAPSAADASLFGVAMAVASWNPSSGNVLPVLSVPRRIAMSGQLLDASGFAVVDATVTASPSTRFLADQSEVSRKQIDALSTPNATTDANGRFQLWLDPILDGAAATYTLDFVPSTLSGTPRWSQENVALSPETTGGLDLGTIFLPEASHARGIMHTSGLGVPGAEFRLYELGTDLRTCVPNEGQSCVPPARSRGLWLADDQGTVRIALPFVDANR